MSTSPSGTGRRMPALIALFAVVLTVLLTAFAWPAVRSQPRDLPVAVAGPPAATAALTESLEVGRAGALDVRAVPDEAAAVDAIHSREVYGAVVVAPGAPPRVLVASAASPVVAQALQQVAAGLGAAAGADVPVEDVVPAPASDPRGAGLAAGALPLAVGGILTAALTSRLLPRLRQRVLAAAGMAVAGGMVTATVLGTWLGSLSGGWWAVSGVVALGIAATALVLLGLEALAGPAGLGVGAATVVLLGNPLSGIATAPELLPAGWGTLGQLLPPGATGSLLRSVSWFDGAGAGRPVLVLTCWVAAGALLCVAAATRRRHTPAPAPAPAEHGAAVPA
ncbi:hypothetical protein GCU56_12835 [Geodermatophilus sabuli]|uniref:ABC transporter permease n=1 Tax=Geodermatophilus sabuli TaxID=1564158 RepID=A0A7K3W3N9_9ACTN|nr:hypothetical protein [Geodermatophilus sabuli]NEK58754.1 hypothetical protein [Geodermatophilus sabuli]